MSSLEEEFVLTPELDIIHFLGITTFLKYHNHSSVSKKMPHFFIIT